MRKYYSFIIGILLLGACKDAPKNVMSDTPTSGSIHISVDESFQPVISEQIKVFEAIHPQADIIPEYKAEADCLRDLQKDSTRMIIVSRELTRDEIKFYRTKLDFTPSFDLIGYDAIAIVVNKANPDSSFEYNDIVSMLQGKGLKKYNVVVDGKNATSTVRYLMDSVLRGKPLGSNVTAAKSSAEVVKYVANTPDAIGFVGVSWMADEDSPNSRVKMGLLECKNCDKGMYAKPSQQTITFKQYPLVRGLYYVLKENATGLGTGFINFLTQERGQLIFKRANLLPGKMQLFRRRTAINQ